MFKDYAQPDFYRFNSDSIALINWFQQNYSTPGNILDLGAGCGIIGIEIARSLQSAELVMVEAQLEFMYSLKKNAEAFLPLSLTYQILHCTFSQTPEEKKFKYIFINPPYYLPGEGEVSENIHRRISRTFVIDDWNILIAKVQKLLDVNGKCFIVIHKSSRLVDKIHRIVREFQLILEIHELLKVFVLEISSLNID